MEDVEPHACDHSRHEGRRRAGRVDKMLAAGRITEAEAARVRAAADDETLDDAIREIRGRHVRGWLVAAVADGRVDEDDVSDALERLDRGEDPRSIMALRRRRP